MKRLLNVIGGAAIVCMPLLTNGQTMWSWGNNLHGELGNSHWGTGFAVGVPVHADTATSWKYIDAGGNTTLALKADSSLWGWGSNGNGQIGDGTTTASYIPKQSGTGRDWIAVSEGEYHAVALKANGTLWTWGSNSFGTLGNGTSTSAATDYTPTQMGTDNNWAAIAAGQWFTVAVKTDGTLWYWGHDNAGAVLTQSTPLQIGTDHDWKTVATGWNSHSIAIKTDGTMWAWGLNDVGQLGQGTTSMPNGVPTKIGTDNDWASASVGHGYTLARKTDGSIWSWGQNDKGQLGDGTTTDKYAPAKVGTANDWKYVTAGRKHSMAIKNNGTLWVWGWNNNSQLGNDSTVDRYTPRQLGTSDDWESISGDELYTIALRRSTVGIGNTIRPARSVAVYPNPAKQYITIEKEHNAVVTIYNVAGKALLTSSEATINVSALPTGVLIYKITDSNNDTYATGTFIKQ